MEMYPRSGQAHFVLGTVAQKSGDKELAIECFEKVLELDPENQDIAHRLEDLHAQ
ncbi:MAG: tetratricopeptide repeat protein [Candidatus Thorarchaeota archaeon]|nr:tetratricopeptide repeat protein [Candidatus Thorarchaeota archaeon]